MLLLKNYKTCLHEKKKKKKKNKKKKKKKKKKANKYSIFLVHTYSFKIFSPINFAQICLNNNLIFLKIVSFFAVFCIFLG